MKLYKSGTIMGAMYAKVEDYEKFRHLMPRDKNTLIITFCNGLKCEKSPMLAEKLIKEGYRNAIAYLEGYPRLEKGQLSTNGHQKRLCSSQKR